MLNASRHQASLGQWRAPSEAESQLGVSLEVSARPQDQASSVARPQTRAGVRARVTSTVQTVDCAGEMTQR